MTSCLISPPSRLANSLTHSVTLFTTQTCEREKRIGCDITDDVNISQRNDTWSIHFETFSLDNFVVGCWRKDIHRLIILFLIRRKREGKVPFFLSFTFDFFLVWTQGWRRKTERITKGGNTSAGIDKGHTESDKINQRTWEKENILEQNANLFYFSEEVQFFSEGQHSQAGKKKAIVCVTQQRTSPLFIFLAWLEGREVLRCSFLWHSRKIIQVYQLWVTWMREPLVKRGCP